MELVASPLALPGITDRVIVAASAVEAAAAAARALLERVLALRDQGDHVARLIGEVADLDGMRAALEDAVRVAGAAQADLIAALADARHERGWQDREEATAVQAPPPRLRLAAGG